MLTDLELWQWALLLLGAFLIGVSKTGVAGLGAFAVAVFALSLPARESVGTVLPVLITADFVAVAAYRRHADWSQLIRLFPWAIVGVIAGYLMVGYIDDRQFAVLIGTILLTFATLQWWRSRPSRTPATGTDDIPRSLWFVATMGILAGFTTMVANAAGPIMVLYLLAMRLPKMAFIGTTAWYFLLVNLFKVPFSVGLGLITSASLALDLRLAPAAIAGALSGRVLIRHIDQRLFENLALAFTFLAALRLLW
jgi:hypothetical protein